jgi:hypothetical protein
MIRAATDRKLRLPTVTTVSTSLKGLLSSPWQLTTGLRMPGESHRGPPPALTVEQEQLAAALRADVSHLAVNIGERNVWRPASYEEARLWIARRLEGMRLEVNLEPYDCHGHTCVNLAAEVRGSTKPEEILVVGAHYDSLKGCPAANDNGSGVAATLAVAAHFAGLPAERRPKRTVRFVFFANEEPPHFWTKHMGSLVCAEACRARGEKIVGMITPETIGYYSDEPGSQLFPVPGMRRVVGDKGDFVAFIGIGRAAPFVRKCVGLFRKHAAFPSRGAAMPSFIPGVGASDHWGFWRQGYPALMVTDTAPFRYRYYHTAHDLPDKMNFGRMAQVVDGLTSVAADLADE